MSVYNWIQEKFFDNYEKWRMKSPDYNQNGFNIVGIDNTFKAMEDGFFMYMELYPPHARVTGSIPVRRTSIEKKAYSFYKQYAFFLYYLAILMS